MKTLEEHQKERLEASQGIKKSDIKCPKCPDGEFYYVDNMTLCTFPAQKNVRCNSCDYRTLVYV